MRTGWTLWMGMVCAVLLLQGGQAAAVTDDMEEDLWTFGQTNPQYDGTASAGYSAADAVSPVRSIRLLLSGGGTSGQDGNTLVASRRFEGAFAGQRLQVCYNIAQQTDVADGWGGMHAAADVVVVAYDEADVALGAYIYRLACSDLHEQPTWYDHMGGDAGSPCHQVGDISYIGTPDAGGEYEPGAGWRTLDVVPSRDLDIDWTAVASVEIRLVLRGAFMHQDTFEALFDDLSFAPIAATVDIDPDTLNLKSGGRWITAFVMLPEEYDAAQVDAAGVSLNGIAAAWGRVCDNGVLMVKFERDDLVALLGEMGLALPAEVTLTVSGMVGDLAFEGSDTIRVIAPGKGPKPKG